MTPWSRRIAALAGAAAVVVAAGGCSATTTGTPTQAETMTSTVAPETTITGEEGTVNGGNGGQGGRQEAWACVARAMAHLRAAWYASSAARASASHCSALLSVAWNFRLSNSTCPAIITVTVSDLSVRFST